MPVKYSEEVRRQRIENESGVRGYLVPCDPDGLLYEGANHIVKRYRSPPRFRVTDKIGGAQTDYTEHDITTMARLLGYDGVALTAREATEVERD